MMPGPGRPDEQWSAKPAGCCDVQGAPEVCPERAEPILALPITAPTVAHGT
jgi:hypothetical protein